MKMTRLIFAIPMMATGVLLASLFMPHAHALTAPNPASGYCDQNGGTLIKLHNSLGEGGYCNLGGGIIGEWTLADYKHDGSKMTRAIDAYINHVDTNEPGNDEEKVISYCSK